MWVRRVPGDTAAMTSSLRSCDFLAPEVGFLWTKHFTHSHSSFLQAYELDTVVLVFKKKQGETSDLDTVYNSPWQRGPRLAKSGSSAPALHPSGVPPHLWKWPLLAPHGLCVPWSREGQEGELRMGSWVQQEPGLWFLGLRPVDDVTPCLFPEGLGLIFDSRRA